MEQSQSRFIRNFGADFAEVYYDSFKNRANWRVFIAQKKKGNNYLQFMVSGDKIIS